MAHVISLFVCLAQPNMAAKLADHPIDQLESNADYAKDVFLSPSTKWTLSPPPPLPPTFMIMTSPMERKISYAQLDANYKAIKGIVKPLIEGGLNTPKGSVYDAGRSRLFVADPGLSAIMAWRIEVLPCYTPEQKAGAWGYGAYADPFRTDPNEGPTACDLEWSLVAKDPVIIVSNVGAEWVNMDKAGSLYYSDILTNSVNKIESTLLVNIVHGEIKASEVRKRSAEEAEAIAAIAAGSHEMQVGQGSGDGNDLMAVEKHPTEVMESDLAAPFETSVVELYSASSSSHVREPAGVAADNVQVYWANSEGGLKAGSVGTGTSHPESAEGGGIKAANLTTITDKTFGMITTQNAIVFSDGMSGVYGVRKFGGGKAVPLNTGFIAARGLTWDGAGTVFVADEGANMVYAMACGNLAENMPIFGVVSMHDVYSPALVKASDPIVKAAMVARGTARLASSMSILAVAVVVLSFCRASQ